MTANTATTRDASTPLTVDDKRLVSIIRRICAREFEMPIDSFFFSAHWRDPGDPGSRPNETIDEMILRIFRSEHENRPLTLDAIERTVLVMCHG